MIEEIPFPVEPPKFFVTVQEPLPKYRTLASDLYLQLTLRTGRRVFPRIDPSILEPIPKPPKTKLRFRSIDEPGDYGG